MSPNRKLSRLLFIVSQLYRLKFVNYFKGEHAKTQVWSNYEITKCCGFLGYQVKVIKIYFSDSKQCFYANLEGAQWLSGRVLDSRPRGRGFEPHRRHCVVVLEQDIFILV